MQENILMNKNSSNILAFFRICVGLLAIIHLSVFFRFSAFLYGDNGIIKPEINRAMRQVFGNYLIDIDVHSFTSIITGHTSLSEAAAINILLVIYLFFLILFTAGFLTPVSAFLCWFLNMILLNSNQLNGYGYDMFMSNCLFLSIFMPVNQYLSLDKYWFKISQNSTLAGYSIIVLRLHLCFIYFFSGINKMASIQWWNGESIWRVLMQPPFLSFDLGFISKYPILLAASSIFVLCVESLYPILIHIRKTKKLIILLAILMHLGIAVFLGLWFFAAVMIILNITIYKTGKPASQRITPDTQTNYHPYSAPCN